MGRPHFPPNFGGSDPPMHYHLLYHGEPGLRGATHTPHSETNLPSTSTLPELNNQPQNPSASASMSAPAGGHLDRMQIEMQALQQQAQATQQSLMRLQAREPTNSIHVFGSDLPAVFSSLDSTMLGIGSGLVLASVIVWWYVWHCPRTRWIDVPPAMAKKPPISIDETLSERNLSMHTPSSTRPPNIEVHEEAKAWPDSNTMSGDTTRPYESGHSPFARHEPNMEFDPEAAASEVTRVRKSLAEKRETRAQLRERDDAVSSLVDLDLDLEVEVDDIPIPNDAETPSVLAWLDGELASKAEVASTARSPASNLDIDLGPGVAEQKPQMQIASRESAMATEESVSFSLADDGALGLELALGADPTSEPPPEQIAESEPEPELALEAEAALEPEPQAERQLALVPEPTPMPNMEHEFGQNRAVAPESGAESYDFTITLALAQESATLELWNEARDLASEVLESDDPKLVSEALSLLERLNQMDLESQADASHLNGAR